MSLDATGSTIPTTQKPPVKFTFTNAANQKDENDPIFCHFYFAGNSDGNTVVWEFMNNATKEPSLWSNGASSTSALPSVSPSAAASISTSSSTTSPQKSSTGSLSVAAIAGISAGIVLGVLAFAAMGLFFFWWKRKQRRRSWMEEPLKEEPIPHEETIGQQNPAEISGEVATVYPVEMGESMEGCDGVNNRKQGKLPIELMGTNTSPVELMDANERYDFR
jgi:hypothetical protein